MLNNLKNGFVKSIPVSIPVAIYGSILGLIALKKGLSLFELILMDITIFAGTSQFLMLELWKSPLPYLEIVAAVFIINLRYLLIGASLKNLFNGYSLFYKISMMHLVADENWAVTIAEENRQKIKPTFVLGGGIIVVITWTLGTVLGYSSGNIFQNIDMTIPGFTVYCVFLSLGVSLYSKSSDILNWLIAGLIAYFAYKFLPGKWHIVIGGLSGAFFSILFSNGEKCENS